MNVRTTMLGVVMAALLLLSTPPAAKALTLDEAVAKIDALISEMETLKAQLNAIESPAISTNPTPQVNGAQSSSILTLSLDYGETNADIARVQRLLATDPAIYEYGADTGFFGPKTQAAVRNFQARFNLDTVGVIGPSTKALLELFMAAYPDENYPATVLQDAVPTGQVLGDSTSNDDDDDVATPVTSSPFRSITVEEESDEFIVRSVKSNGERHSDLILYPDDRDELVEMIADELSISESTVTSLLRINSDWFESSSRNDDADEDDAEDAIEDADDALDRVRDLIRDAEEDDVDTEDAEELYDEGRDLLEEAEEELEDEDYDKAVELAEEAEELADEAEEELDDAEASAEDIDEIRVEVREDESEVEVEYENGDEDRFDVDETDREEVIEAIADELDIDEDVVEDVVEFDYGDIDRVSIVITDDQTRVRVYFESGFDLKFTTDEDDEDDIIEAVADEFDLDEDELETHADVDDRR